MKLALMVSLLALMVALLALLPTSTTVNGHNLTGVKGRKVAVGAEFVKLVRISIIESPEVESDPTELNPMNKSMFEGHLAPDPAPKPKHKRHIYSVNGIGSISGSSLLLMQVAVAVLTTFVLL